MPEADEEASPGGLAAVPGAGTGARHETAIETPAEANGGTTASWLLSAGDAERGDGEQGRGTTPGLKLCFRLSVVSVIFGCSCVGIYALVNAVKARENHRWGRVEAARKCQKAAIKWSALSFLTFVGSFAFGLAFIVLVSYLIRVAE
uniref:transmembrane protein 265-like isoform X2 n=1 Tax=Pristiophorus japonicus TaxID=55135 RepID=UPI00398EC916